jgi:hypothetical protein
LKRDLQKRLGAEVEILNTGHLGYSPEQYYYTLEEYARKFPPRFVVVSFFANDFGGLFHALDGKGDWEESAYWLNRIRMFCASREIADVTVPAPWVNQIEGPLRSGFYPGLASNRLVTSGDHYLDPLDDFVNAHLEAINEAARRGEQLTSNPLFNGRIGDGHFSAKGCEVWAATVGARLAELIMKREMARVIGNEPAAAGPSKAGQ